MELFPKFTFFKKFKSKESYELFNTKFDNNMKLSKKLLYLNNKACQSFLKDLPED